MAGAKTFLQRYKQLSVYRRLVTMWHAIVSIGITADLSAWDKKRIRLLNGISAMGMLALSVFSLSYLDAAHRLTFIESFQGVIAYAFILFLTSRHRYNAACHFFNIYNLISYTFQAVSHGPGDGVEYVLLASSIASMLIFRNVWIIVVYFFLNGLCFALCKYSFTAMKPFLFMSNGENLYTSNHILVFIILFLIVYYFKSENIRQEKLLEAKNESLAEEKHKSDSLLLNILPHETAEEIKLTGSAKSRSFKMVTVMFTDFKNFTIAAETMQPESLVSEIHSYFSVFDAIMARYNIEKIKTIGDSYMCAGGLPEVNSTHPADVVMAALEIQEYMQQVKKEKMQRNELFFELRLGIHTGPVVAGIVGIKKYSYDIWGDTVNIASRMESSGQVGKVNISGDTYKLVQHNFNCTYRGKIDAKNKGQIDMYFVEGVR